MNLSTLLESDGLRTTCYGIAALTALWAGWREQRAGHDRADLWPSFWYVNALLLGTFAIGSAANVADVITDLGRRTAAGEGWYAERRGWQTGAVAVITAAWFVVVAVVLWRFPERRRRYLPMTLVTFTLVCFVGIRMISLHRVDSLLYRRDLAGVRVVTIVELGLIVLTVAAELWPMLHGGRRLARAGAEAGPP